MSTWPLTLLQNLQRLRQWHGRTSPFRHLPPARLSYSGGIGTPRLWSYHFAKPSWTQCGRDGFRIAAVRFENFHLQFRNSSTTCGTIKWSKSCGICPPSHPCTLCTGGVRWVRSFSSGFHFGYYWIMGTGKLFVWYQSWFATLQIQRSVSFAETCCKYTIRSCDGYHTGCWHPESRMSRLEANIIVSVSDKKMYYM